MYANHYPLKTTIQVSRSLYRHRNPAGYASYLRWRGFDATPGGGGVLVYHATGEEPGEKRWLVSRILLSPSTDPDGFLRALNAHIGFTLRCAGFLKVGKGARREYISPETHVRPLIVEERGKSQP